jgi:hypothetical protein
LTGTYPAIDAKNAACKNSRPMSEDEAGSVPTSEVSTLGYLRPSTPEEGLGSVEARMATLITAGGDRPVNHSLRSAGRRAVWTIGVAAGTGLAV